MNSTPYQLPTSIIMNAPGVAGWLDPSNLFLVDGRYAISNGPANITTVGNFNLNIPQGSLITNFIVQVKGYIGSFNTTLQIYAIDDTTGVTLSYPLAPFTSFNGTNTLYSLSASLFGTTWTVNQANNIKFQLIANGVLYLDAILVSGIYVPSATLTINYNTLSGTFLSGEIVNDLTSGASATIVTDNGTNLMTVSNVVGNFDPSDSIEGATSLATALINPPPSGQIVVDEFVEAQTFQLAQSMTATDVFMFLESFNYPDGTPIQYADFYGTEGCLVIDQGVPGSEEQTLIASVEQNYQGSGMCRIGFGTLANRGLKFSYPYNSQSQLIVSHFGTAQCVISNDARFYSRFLKVAQIDALVSPPITVAQNGTSVTTSLHTLNFIDPYLTAVLNGAHIIDVNIDFSALVTGLVADSTFINDLITQININGSITVSVDGTTITGDGSVGNPLVAHAGGSSGITDINGNTTAHQIIQGTSGDISVSSSSGTTTIGLINTVVTPGSYTNSNITVDANGRIITASNGTLSTGGAWTKIQTVSWATTSLPTGGAFTQLGQFTGLDGDTDDEYMIMFEVVYSFTAIDGTFGITFNNDTSTDYTTGSSSGLNAYEPIGIGNPNSFGEVKIKANRTYVNSNRLIYSNSFGTVGTGQISSVGTWTGTGNITTIEVRMANNAGTIQTSTGIATLYKINR